MFLASDLGGYAAVASILSLKVPSYVGGRTGSSVSLRMYTDGLAGIMRGDVGIAPYEMVVDGRCVGADAHIGPSYTGRGICC